MSEKISKRQELLALLKNNPLTADELTEKLEIPIKHVRIYISQFSKEGKIIKSGKKGRYNLYETVDVKLIETNDSELKGILKVYNILFSKITTNFKIFEYIQKTDNSIIEFIENHEEFDKAVELVK